MSLITRTSRGLALSMAVLILIGCGRAAQDEDAPIRPTVYNLGDPVAEPDIAALVDSEYGADTLTTEFFLRQYNLIMERLPQLGANPAQQEELRRNIVEEFVRRHVVFGEADREGIRADTLEVADQMDRLRAQFGTDEEFQEALAMNEISEDSLRASIAEDLRQQAVLEHFAASVGVPSDLEIERYRRRQAEEVQAQHILFLTQPGISGEDRDNIRSLAEAVRDSARQGIDFAELAQRHSDDGSAARGGDLGFFQRGQMVPEFEQAAFALSDSGDVTRDLVETQYGYHIIRLTGRRTGEVMDTSLARQRLEMQRRQRLVQDRVQDLTEGAVLRVNPDVVQAEINRDA